MGRRFDLWRGPHGLREADEGSKCWITLNGESDDYKLYDYEDTLKSAIGAVSYQRLEKKPDLDVSKRYFDYDIPYNDAAYLRISEAGLAWVHFLEDGPFSTDIQGYYSLSQEDASHLYDVAEEVIAEGKAAREEAQKKAYEESDLPHFLEACSKLDRVWMSSIVPGNGISVEDDGSVLSTMKEATHTLVASGATIGKKEILAYNSWLFPTFLSGWSYVLYDDKQTARVSRDFKYVGGDYDSVTFDYELPLEDGEAIWNAFAKVAEIPSSDPTSAS